jgi:preprotein translocase subunit YajC
MDVKVEIIAVVLLVIIVLIIFLIRINQKDKKEFEKETIDSENIPDKHKERKP